MNRDSKPYLLCEVGLLAEPVLGLERVDLHRLYVHHEVVFSITIIIQLYFTSFPGFILGKQEFGGAVPWGLITVCLVSGRFQMAATFDFWFGFESFGGVKYLLIRGSEQDFADITIVEYFVRLELLWGLTDAMDILDLFLWCHWLTFDIPGGHTEWLGSCTGGKPGVGELSRHHLS